MQQNHRLALNLLSALTLVACGGNNTGPGGAGGAGGASGAPSQGLPCEVDAILAANCRTCHGAKTQFGAPMSLVTYADLTRPAVSDPKRKVYELLTERTHSDQRPMPPPPNARLSAGDQKALDAWISAGAALSAESCAGGPGSSTSSGGATGAPSCKPDIHVSFPSNYMMPKDKSDEYICAGIEVTATEKRHITAFIPHIDNSKIVHHIVLYQADAAQPAGPSPCTATPGRIVSVWAPGVNGFELPKEAGIPLEGTTHYLLQIHYNNLQHLEGESDASGFDLCSTTELRPNDADVLALGTFTIDIPAHGSLDTTCDLIVPKEVQELHLVGSMPHMHKLGTKISTVNHPGGTGAAVDLGGREVWDFSNQYWTPLDQTIKGGDKISTRCAWTNPGDTNVTFGENTENEMCFSFTMYYPKIADPNWNWTYPALLLSKCAPTP